MSINLFPARVPIGRVQMPNNQQLDVLMTPEFSRALADVFARIGGTNGMGSDDMALLESFATIPTVPDAQAGSALVAAPADQSAQIATMLAQIEALRAEVGAYQPYAALAQQLEDIRVLLGMQEDPGAAVRALVTKYAPLDSPNFTGTPTAPTAAVDTTTTQLATTAFVVGQASAVAPLMDAVAAIGTSKRYARADHVHPVDTSRQAAISITQSTSGEVTTVVSGDFTVASVSLAPGTYLLNGTMQTVNAAGATITRAAINITTNVADSGYNNSTNASYGQGADAQNYNPGGNADLRCKSSSVYTNATAGAVTVYLRGNIVITAGTIAYKGTITAVKI
jgi:hypothetical protein